MSDSKYQAITNPAMRILEKCGVIIQTASKAEQFGWRHCSLDTPEKSNLDIVENELQELIEIVWELKCNLTTPNNKNLVKGPQPFQKLPPRPVFRKNSSTPWSLSQKEAHTPVQDRQ